MTARLTPTRGLAAACLLCLTPSAYAQDEGPDPAWVDEAALQRGEIVWRTGKASPRIATIDAAVLIRATPAMIWSILIACEIAPEYVPHVTDCSRIETFDDGSAELFKQTVKPAFFIPSFEHVFRLDYTPYERIEVSRVSGPLAHMQGIWRLRQRDDGTVLLTHELALDPGIPLPRFFVRTALRRDLPKVLDGVRARAEAQASPPATAPADPL